jgi:hypothetical protein
MVLERLGFPRYFQIICKSYVTTGILMTKSYIAVFVEKSVNFITTNVAETNISSSAWSEVSFTDGDSLF